MRLTLCLDDTHDSVSAKAALEQGCDEHRLPDVLRQQVLGTASPIIELLARQGRDVASNGGQFTASKTLNVEEHRITIQASYGKPKNGWMKSLLGIFGSHP